MQVVENIAEITAQNHSDSSGKDSVKFKGKRSGRVGPYWEKPCPRSWVPLEAWVLPEDLEHSFSQYGPPGWRIPYI